MAPHFYNRYNALQAHCKVARENNNQLRTKILYGKDLVLQEKHQGDKHYTTVEINKYREIPPMDTKLPWPTHEVEIPMTTPPKGRPNTHTPSNTQTTQKRPLSSPESSQFITVKNKKHKKTKKKLNAESSISDHHNSSDDENISDLAYIHKTINGKRH